MTERSTDAPVGAATAGARRLGRRGRGRFGLAGLVAATLVWAAVSFAADSGAAGTTVTILEGTSPDGEIATVTPLAGEIVEPGNRAKKQEGVQVARIDVATAFHRSIRVSIGWLNPSAFEKASLQHGWQVRTGLYYPVHTGNCTGTDADDAAHAVTFVTPGDGSFCAYRDGAATGPGAVTSEPHVGTQLLSHDYLVGTLLPAQDQATGVIECLPTGTDPCWLDDDLNDVDDGQRTWFVAITALNPGSNAPPGQQGQMEALQLHVRVARAGAAT